MKLCEIGTNDFKSSFLSAVFAGYERRVTERWRRFGQTETEQVVRQKVGQTPTEAAAGSETDLVN